MGANLYRFQIEGSIGLVRVLIGGQKLKTRITHGRSVWYFYGGKTLIKENWDVIVRIETLIGLGKVARRCGYSLTDFWD